MEKDSGERAEQGKFFLSILLSNNSPQACRPLFLADQLTHRGLKLDGAIGQGEICNSLKSENFSKSFLSHIGKN